VRLEPGGKETSLELSTRFEPSLEETQQVRVAQKGQVLDLLSSADGKETICNRGYHFYNSDSLFQGGQGLKLSQDTAPISPKPETSKTGTSDQSMRLVLHVPPTLELP